MPPLTGSVAFLSLHWAKLRSHNDADMLILCDIHNGHRMSSGLWNPDGPLLTLGFVPCVHIQTLVTHPINNIQWWGKVVAGVIYLVYLLFPQPTLLAPRASLYTFCRLHAICQVVFWVWPCLSLLRAFEMITLHDQQNFAVNILSCLQSLWLSQVGLESSRRWRDFFLHEWNNSSSCLANGPLAYSPFWW